MLAKPSTGANTPHKIAGQIDLSIDLHTSFGRLVCAAYGARQLAGREVLRRAAIMGDHWGAFNSPAARFAMHGGFEGQRGRGD